MHKRASEWSHAIPSSVPYCKPFHKASCAAQHWLDTRFRLVAQSYSHHPLSLKRNAARQLGTAPGTQPASQGVLLSDAAACHLHR